MFSKRILISLLEKYNFYLQKIKTFYTDMDFNSSRERIDLVHELLAEENKMLTNALAIVEQNKEGTYSEQDVHLELKIWDKQEKTIIFFSCLPQDRRLVSSMLL